MKDLKTFLTEAVDDNNAWSKKMWDIMKKIEKLIGSKLGEPEPCNAPGDEGDDESALECTIEGITDEIQLSVIFDGTGTFIIVTDDMGVIEMAKPGVGTLEYDDPSLWGKYNVDDAETKKLFSKTSLLKFAKEYLA